LGRASRQEWIAAAVIVGRLVNWNYALWFGTLASMVGVFSTTSLGIDAWIIGFVALIGTSAFFLPFQSSTYQAIHQELSGRLFSHRRVRSVGPVYALLSLAALALSLPVWHLMGLV
jgi:hypothetical protein